MKIDNRKHLDQLITAFISDHILAGFNDSDIIRSLCECFTLSDLSGYTTRLKFNKDIIERAITQYNK